MFCPVPPFTRAHEALRADARAFVRENLRPYAATSGRRPAGSRTRCSATSPRAGWLGLKYDGDWVADAVLTEELARCGSGGVAAGIGAHVHIATPPIFRFGTDAQKARWLEPAMRGERIGALAITEPDAGSDVAAIRTRAVRVDGGWLVNGAKTFITNGVRADFFVTAVQTPARGATAGCRSWCSSAARAFSASALAKLGWRASDTAELAFDDVFVPDEHLLGEEGRGFYLIMANFQWERLVMALGAVGAMRRTIERVVGRARASARPTAIRHRRRSRARAEAATAMTYHALRLSSPAATPSARSRWPSSPPSAPNFELQDECLQIHGGPDPRVSSARSATPASARSAAAPTRSCARSSGGASDSRGFAGPGQLRLSRAARESGREAISVEFSSICDENSTPIGSVSSFARIASQIRHWDRRRRPPLAAPPSRRSSALPRARHRRRPRSPRGKRLTA